MTTLLLRLAGPMQAWGASSRFVRRTTETQPTKSGVLGLLAAAMGRRRADPLEDLLGLRFGVRIDQPGRLLRDFQTARPRDGKRPMPLSYRYYLADAAFVAAVEGECSFIAGLNEALRKPAFPLYLGRRSCPPAGRLSLGTRDLDVFDSLTCEPWAASAWWQRRSRSARVELDIVMDARESSDSAESLTDMPVSFDPERRLYALRRVDRAITTVDNPNYRGGRSGAPPRQFDDHDPISAVGGG